MLIVAHKVFQEEKYLKDAVECGGGDLTERPAEERLWYLSRHGGQRLLLPQPLPGHPGEEVPLPCKVWPGAIHYLSELTQSESSLFPAFEL
ncbi:lanC-like protein 2 [Salvelinus alpinus]|uniref:lanC-like protein 2 n=1 Tax=Salvelinus alpinus TaxID=8036 RepID=UPI0039FD064D